MAFVPNYEHDIFISYAHVDNELFPGVTQTHDGWVTTLHNCLKIYLAQKLGRSDCFSIWMDYKLLGHENLTPQIMDAIKKSAILLIVLSPGYVRSEWCQREKNTFLQFVKEQNNSRIFIVERDQINETDRFVEFRDLLGFRFWKTVGNGERTHIFGTPTLTAEDREYYDLAEDMTRQLANLMIKMKAESGAYENINEIRTDAYKGTVFLAQVTDDLDPQRNNVKRYLNQAGYKVLPETWYSLDPEIFKQSVIKDLEESTIFIQLLSAVPGKKPPDLSQGYNQFQLDLAVEAQKPILQWRSPDLDLSSIEDADHLKLLEGNQVRAESIEDFKQEIRTRLAEKPRKNESISAFVFVNMETTDRPLAEQVCTVLDRYGVDYCLPIQSEDPAKNREDLEQNLEDCNAIIIIYGCSTVDWVRNAMRQSRKILANRKTPLRAFAVFEGPPEQKCPLDMKFTNMQVLNSRSGFNETELEKFLYLLKQGGE